LHKKYGKGNEDKGIKLIHTEIIFLMMICDTKPEELSCAKLFKGRIYSRGKKKVVEVPPPFCQEL